MTDVAKFVPHDINNLLAVISSGLRLLECQSDAAYRKAIVCKMQEAIRRGALLSRQFLDAARPRPEPIGGFVDGGCLAAIAGMLDRPLRPEITVRIEIAPDLRAFNANADELCFALLNLFRNSADSMPDGGAITLAVGAAELSAGTTGRTRASALGMAGSSPRSSVASRLESRSAPCSQPAVVRVCIAYRPTA